MTYIIAFLIIGGFIGAIINYYDSIKKVILWLFAHTEKPNLKDVERTFGTIFGLTAGIITFIYLLKTNFDFDNFFNYAYILLIIATIIGLILKYVLPKYFDKE